MDKDALRKLIEAVEAEVKYETAGHTRMCQRAFPKPSDFDGSREAYAKSAAQLAILTWRNNDLNAAKALHEALLPGWDWAVASKDEKRSGLPMAIVIQGPPESDDVSAHNAKVPYPARAWLLAILKAVAAQP